jgi:predicted dehydrogenase
MKQVLQSLRSGTVEVADVPAPAPGRGTILVSTTASLISAGTERMLAEFGNASWLNKARQQPDKVRMVLDKARTDGVLSAVEAIQSKLDTQLAPGYCNVGIVHDVGAGIEGIRRGDRVVCNGKHAEMVATTQHLCARIPDAVSDESATFVVLAAIGLQGIRLTQPTVGECVVVTGLGLVGLLTVQLLRAQGCRVLGIDPDPARRAIAASYGAEVIAPGSDMDLLNVAMEFSRGRGVDAVLITASTRSNAPVSQAARMSRKRGRIVLVGVTGLELSRADFYEKELSFQVSCSYGPGRHDAAYETQGHDYPVGFVRWTEQRNFEAVLDLTASRALDVQSLITHRFPIERAADAYALLTSSEPSLGILLQYPAAPEIPISAVSAARRVTLNASLSSSGSAGTIGFLGAGNYASRVLAPAFRAAGASLRTIVSAGGVSAVSVGRKHGFAEASTDADALLDDRAIDAVVIATRHGAHAQQVCRALEAGKHVFCEKPLCLTLAELAEVQAVAARHPELVLMVGFNRRFAPHVEKMHALLGQVPGPKAFVMTVNAGAIPASHWTQDRADGGGRLLGEGCHFIDLLRFLAGSPIERANAVAMGPRDSTRTADDHVSITLTFADGSIGTIHYLANGHKGFPKERLEVFAGGRILQLDNFRKLRSWGWGRESTLRLWRQDKGHRQCVAAFMESVRRGAPSPIDREEIFEVSQAAIDLAARVRN